MKKPINLDKCLEYANIEKLPQEWDGKTPFLKAILLVEKMSGDNDYMIGSIDADMNLYATKTFNNSIIGAYLKAYPYLMLDGNSPEKEDKTIKVKMDDIKTFNETLPTDYYGVEGLVTVNDAKEWIIANGNSNLSKSNKPEKLKENIEKIKNNLNTEE